MQSSLASTVSNLQSTVGLLGQSVRNLTFEQARLREQQAILARELAELARTVAERSPSSQVPAADPAPVLAPAAARMAAMRDAANGARDRVIARELHGAAMRHVPFLPKEIEVGSEAISIEAYAGAPEGLAANMAFFVNGRRFDEVDYPIFDLALQAKFSEARGMGFVARARLTRELDEVLAARFLRFDASPTGHFVPANWRQAFHFMNPSCEKFPFPPATNIKRVIGDTSTTRFAMGGATMFKNMEAYLGEIGHGWSEFPRILDWGCGAGRLTRYLLSETDSRVCGVDIDADAIAWCKSAFPGGEFDVVPLQPPTSFAAESFDLVVGVSVLTHLREDDQWAWLAELRRITRPGALVFLSVRGPTQHAYDNLPPHRYAQLQEQGFLDLSRDAALDEQIEDKEYYRASLHSRQYIVDNWGRYFEVIAIVDAIAALQDFVVLRRRS